MRVEVVQHHADHLGAGIQFDQMLHRLRKIDLVARRRHQHFARAPFWLANHQQIEHAVALVFHVVARRLPRLGRQRLAHFRDQLLGTFVEAHHRPLLVIRLFVQIQYIFYRRHEIGAYFRNAPLLLLPRLEEVFLSTPRTDS